MSTNLDSIKRKINALLSKTVENGATEAEAISALKKANELMLAYYISENDLNDPYLDQKCKSEEVSLIPSAYDMKMFFAHLCKLFDCFHFYNSQRVVFFGFEQDAKLCAFFYVLITKTCLSEKEKYLKSDEFKSLKQHHHSKTLVASFIKGFLIGICKKLDAMYQDRNSSIPAGMGLMVIQKKERVKNEFEGLQLKIRSSKTVLRAELGAFESGVAKGEEFYITQGVETNKREAQKMIL